MNSDDIPWKFFLNKNPISKLQSYSSKSSSSHWNSNKSYNRSQGMSSNSRGDYGSFGQMVSTHSKPNSNAMVIIYGAQYAFVLVLQQ